jgi:hypothetical protein
MRFGAVSKNRRRAQKCKFSYTKKSRKKSHSF